jgi:hypothetical protein
MAPCATSRRLQFFDSLFGLDISEALSGPEADRTYAIAKEAAAKGATHKGRNRDLLGL